MLFYLALVTKEEESGKEKRLCNIDEGTKLVTVFKVSSNFLIIKMGPRD